jgi:hypothetical protein
MEQQTGEQFTDCEAAAPRMEASVRFILIIRTYFSYRLLSLFERSATQEGLLRPAELDDFVPADHPLRYWSA